MEIKDYTWLQIDPVDAWFFRDGRPADRGEFQGDLVSDFPPNALTVIGSIRAALARSQGWSGKGSQHWEQNIAEILGDGFDNLGHLQFVGPFFMHRTDLLWPMPLHVLGKVTQEMKDGQLTDIFHPCDWLVPSSEKTSSDAGDVLLPKPMKPLGKDITAAKLKQGHGFYVTTDGFSDILSGKLPKLEACLHRKQLFRYEVRTGIQRDGITHGVVKGALYRPRFIRMTHDTHLVMGISGIPDDWQLPESIPLGGLARQAYLKHIECPIYPQATRSPDTVATVSLVTPASFVSSWYGCNPNNSASQLAQDLKGTIKTLAVDRPVRIGGWNSLAGEPLPLRPYAAPGTTWWIESEDMQKKSCYMLGNNNEFGYGLAFVGNEPVTDKY